MAVRRKKKSPGMVAAWVIGIIMAIVAVGVTVVAILPASSGGGSGVGEAERQSGGGILTNIGTKIDEAGGLASIVGKVQGKVDDVVSGLQSQWSALTA